MAKCTLSLRAALRKQFLPKSSRWHASAFLSRRTKYTVGWSVLIPNCCTSYPIPTSVIVYRNGKKTAIAPGQMIYEWQFLHRGKRIAILSGPVHGRAATAGLYEAQSGRMLKTWHGRGTVPDWAKGWIER